ncbi:hypothetical protein [Brucella rhizosphaerae]|uniref:hypothetical protein n=1 Tax=Brucella rhizosphaerae TaxID=571254 RepID=UPI00361F5038
MPSIFTSAFENIDQFQQMARGRMFIDLDWATMAMNDCEVQVGALSRTGCSGYHDDEM